jgi:hypothetical protein
LNVQQFQRRANQPWSASPPEDADFAMLFASVEALDRADLGELREQLGDALLIGASTAGEIHGTRIEDDTLTLTTVRFESPVTLQAASMAFGDKPCRQAGLELAALLGSPVHATVLAAGAAVNGSELAEGLTLGLPARTIVTGGIAADGDRFGRTLVVLGDQVMEESVVGLALAGGQLEVGYGCFGGWDPFGPVRRVTRAEGNVLYELEGKPALDLYERYLGPYVQGLPASALRFPLALELHDRRLVRTVLGIDRAARSMTFAGAIPEGSSVRLMKANTDRLVDGASSAALMAQQDGQTELAMLVSCVGRRLVLKQRTEEELDAVRDVIGPKAHLTGFYSYGELCPSSGDHGSELHNQTMTVTTLREAL